MTFIRSSIFTLFLAVFTVLFVILVFPALAFGEDCVRAANKFWCRRVLAALKLICGVSYRVEGAENICKDGAIVASNHQSMWETIVLFALFPKPAMVLKKELVRVPVYGWWVGSSGNIVVDRAAGAKAMRLLAKTAAAKIADGCQVILFPEGTRSTPGERLDYQPGIAGVYKASDCICVPVAHDSGRHWRYPGILKIPGEITIRILPPIASGLHRKKFMPLLKAQIESARPDLSDHPVENPSPQDALMCAP